jgi:zinc protease
MACDEPVRYGSPVVARAPHPAWSPAPGAPSVTPDEPFRAQPPERPAFVAPPLPEAHSAIVGHVRAITLERHALPIVAIRIVVARGATQAPPGVAMLAAATLFDGTKTSKRRAVQETLADMGATFSAWASQDAVTIDAKVPASNVLPALKVLSHVVRAPGFPAEWIEIERAARISALAREAATPSTLAGRQLDEALYPPGHPYHVPAEGDPASLARVTRDDLVRFWEAAAVPAQTTVILAGDFDRATVEARLKALYDDWSATASPASPIPAPTPAAGRVLLFDHPGDSQSVVRIGWLVGDRDSADLGPLRVLAGALAHDSTGTLDWVLRGERGETYGVSAWVTPRPGASEFVIGAAIETERTAEALAVIAKEIERVRSHPLESSEIPGAVGRTNVLTWQSFETTSNAVAALTPAAIYGEPLERFLDRVAVPRIVGGEDLQRVAQKYLSPESRVVVVVGDASRVRPGLEAAGFR